MYFICTTASTNLQYIKIKQSNTMYRDKYKYSLRTYKESIRLVGYMNEQWV